ncbi:MAG: U32 family peptidase [bacterium]|nr:U32 family peptidase [bacterium]
MALTKLTMGPNLFKWQPDDWRDFYFRLADEAPLDCVYLGEVVCDKRSSFVLPYMDKVVERLQNAGKEVVFSTLALVMSKPDRKTVRSVIADHKFSVEINDISALAHLTEHPTGKPHVIGPMINCYNEETMGYFALKGSKRICLPVELPLSAIKTLSEQARKLDVEVEILAFGRMPLAVSARCYHARVYKLSKDSCRFVCGEDPDGLSLQTLDDEDFLTINGIQTMSHSILNLLNDLDILKETGVGSFRLSPHSCDMVEVTRLFRSVLDQEISPIKASKQLATMGLNAPFSNGYLHNEPGVSWTVNNSNYG